MTKLSDVLKSFQKIHQKMGECALAIKFGGKYYHIESMQYNKEVTASCNDGKKQPLVVLNVAQEIESTEVDIEDIEGLSGISKEKMAVLSEALDVMKKLKELRDEINKD